MNKIIIYAAKIIVKIMNLIFYNCKIKNNKITYISYKNNKLPKNMKMIRKYINRKYPYVDEAILAYKFTNSIADKFWYFIELIKQVYHIKTSKVVVLDGNNFVISNIDISKETKIVQIWHATGAIKKFGNDYKRTYPIRAYDYIITTSSKSIGRMASAFSVEEKCVLPLGYPNTDNIFNKKKFKEYREYMLKKYDFIKDKKVILYAPTFRGEGVYDKKYCSVDFNKTTEALGDEYIIIYKMHPILQSQEIKNKKNIYDLSKEELYKIFSITDILISDFSSIIYDFLILEKPILLHVPDLKDYVESRGTYEDYYKFAPGKISCNEDELIETIKSNDYDLEKIRQMKNEFYDNKDDKSTKRISEFIISLLSNEG